MRAKSAAKGSKQLNCIGLQFGGSEAIITALGDEYPIIRKHREIFVAILFTFYFCVGLGSVTQVRHRRLRRLERQR